MTVVHHISWNNLAPTEKSHTILFHQWNTQDISEQIKEITTWKSMKNWPTTYSFSEPIWLVTTISWEYGTTTWPEINQTSNLQCNLMYKCFSKKITFYRSPRYYYLLISYNTYSATTAYLLSPDRHNISHRAFAKASLLFSLVMLKLQE